MESIDTKCVQAGYQPKNGEPRIVPITQSTTYVYDTPEQMGDLFDLKTSGYFYTRLGNPTLAALEEKLTALEGGVGALATSSGMAATTLATLNLCDAGDNFISFSEIYGGTYNLFNVTLRKLNIDCRFVDNNAKVEDIEKLIDDKTRFLFCETIANPAGKIADFKKLAAIAKKHQMVLIVDNTISTPYICRPIEHGANVIIHSSTKYLDGHATSVGGVIVDAGNFAYLNNQRYKNFNEPDKSYHGMIFAKDVGRAAFITRARGIGMRDIGAQMAPMNAFLTVLGIETLHLRICKHSENALALARAIKLHPQVEWVKYAGLEDDYDNAKLAEYFDDKLASGMVSFGIRGGIESALTFQKNLKLFKIATHVADVRSCVLHPATTTHRQLSKSDLAAAGVPDNLVRLSVGIEGEKDIIKDVINALDSTKK